MAYWMWRGVVGVIKPTHRPGSLEEFIRLLPEGVGVIPLFLSITKGIESEFIDAMEPMKEKIAELAKLKVDLIHPEGAPLFMLRGYHVAEEMVKGLEDKYGIPIVTTGMVLVEALKAMGIQRMVGVSYSEGETREKYQKYALFFKEAGIELLGMEAFRFPFSEVGRIPSREVYAFTKRQYLNYPKAQGVCMVGSGWRVLDIIQMLEQDLGVPVIHPVPARVWAIEKRLHVRQPVEGYGRLLREMP